jgi:hypothetical protein
VEYDDDSEPEVIMERDLNVAYYAGPRIKQPFQRMVGMTKHAEKTMVRQLVVYLTLWQGFGI